MRLKSVGEQVVVVMGASSGMGRLAALAFARRGAKVVAAARSEEGLHSLQEEIRQAGGEATAVLADVADFDQVKSVADTAVRIYGRLDTWVHFASVAVYGEFEKLAPEEFKRVIDVNLTGAAYGAMAALPHLRREGRGAFIGVSSVLAKRSVPLLSAYCASKHGFEGLMESLRLELRRDGVPISVTNVMPSAIDTPFFSKARTKLGVKPRGTPPLYDAQVVVDAVLYAAEHPIRDVMGGGANQPMLLLQRISPRLLDTFMIPLAFSLQKTNEPKGADAPSNLFKPIPSQDRVTGDSARGAKGWSAYTWLETHPELRLLLASGALGVAVLLAVRKTRTGK